MTMVDGPLTEELVLAQFEQVPAQQAAAIHVLYVADDPTASSGDLSAAVSLDPVLTAQVMRLANSAFYGLSGRVRSAEFAVTVLGFATVRSIAAAYAAGALGDGATTPLDFWEHAARTASGAALVAPRLRVPRPEAFSLGLLHDLGGAVLRGLAPAAYAEMDANDVDPDTRSGQAHERRQLGMDHAAVGATVLSAWRFPEEMVTAVGSHHDVFSSLWSPLQRCLAAGQALGELAAFEDFERYEASKAVPRIEDNLRAGDVDPHSAFDLSRAVRVEALGIAASFVAY